jgi:DedD protein
MDIALKQRLVGAVVLIALAVVVLPMLLGGRPEEGAPDTRRIELPPQPSELDFQRRRYPVGEQQAAAQPDAESATSLTLPEPAEAPDDDAASAAEAGPGEVAHVELPERDFQDALDETAPGDGTRASAATPEPPPGAATAPATSAPPSAETQADSDGRYIVQVASFGSLANANRLADTLRGQDYVVLLDTVDSEVGKLHRVRVGPYASEALARTVAARITAQLPDVKPRVMDLQPEQAAQVTTPSDPLVRWVVQVGSFSSEANADSLVGKLRDEGLTAYREAVSSGGSTIYRVRVGPFLEREEAIRVDALVNQRLSLDGVVMSAD